MQYTTLTANPYQYANVIAPRNTICNLTRRFQCVLDVIIYYSAAPAGNFTYGLGKVFGFGFFFMGGDVLNF